MRSLFRPLLTHLATYFIMDRKQLGAIIFFMVIAHVTVSDSFSVSELMEKANALVELLKGGTVIWQRDCTCKLKHMHTHREKSAHMNTNCSIMILFPSCLLYWRTRDSTPCRVSRSVRCSVHPVACLNSERFSHYCSCPTVRDCIAVYPALFIVLSFYGV